MRISDWSSDVCSSDLPRPVRQDETQRPDDMRRDAPQHLALLQRLAHQAEFIMLEVTQPAMDQLGRGRSEERRVGKECVSTCRSRWSRYHYKKKKMTSK